MTALEKRLLASLQHVNGEASGAALLAPHQLHSTLPQGLLLAPPLPCNFTLSLTSTQSNPLQSYLASFHSCQARCAAHAQRQ